MMNTVAKLRSYRGLMKMIKNIITKKFKNKKIIFIFLSLIICGTVLIISDNQHNDKTTKEYQITNDVDTYTYTLEKKLEQTINLIDGVNNASVMITLESGNEYVYASDDTEVSQKHVIVDNGLVCVTEKLPKIRGVAVVCDGGNSSAIKTKITELVCSVLGIYSNCIYVTE